MQHKIDVYEKVKIALERIENNATKLEKNISNDRERVDKTKKSKDS